MARPWASRAGIATELAVAAGLAIAYVDASPRWDDTGITVFALLIASALTAALAGSRPWLYALAVGMWVPILEIPQGAGGAPLVALLFSGVGAGVGYVLGTTFQANR
jgi:hypothetical protein